MNTVKRNPPCFILLLTLTIVQITPVNATSEPVIKVEPYASTAQVGETFTVNVTLTDVQNLYGVEITLQWNASILQLVDVDVRLGVESIPDGVLHEDIRIIKNETIQEEGKYTLVGVSMAPAPSFNGSGNIVRITFNVTKVMSCKLNLATELADRPPQGQPSRPIEHTTIGGFFGPIHIFALPTPTTITLGEIINISGFIVPAQANVEVKIQYKREGETDWLILATRSTDEQGNYQLTWRPQEGGEYEIRATAIIDGKEETSYSLFITVNVPEQPTWSYLVIIIVLIIILAIAAIVIYRKKSKS